MQSSAEEPQVRPEKRSLKKGAGLLISISILSMLCFLAVVVWINWEKPRVQTEPLSPEVRGLIERFPGKSDALIYLGLKDIRQSGFWKEIIPDSLKKAPVLITERKLDDLIRVSGINLSEDLDTLIISFRRKSYNRQDYLGIASGPFAEKLPESLLLKESSSSEPLNGHTCYELDNSVWICPIGHRRVALASNRELLEQFLSPKGSFFQRDSLASALIDKAEFKSHLWFALPSAAWTSGALQSLTSANKDMKAVGNLNRIQHLALSVKFTDGINAGTEWIYKTRRAAYFASTFIWGAVKLSGITGTRTSEQKKELLEKLKIEQNLESVIIHMNLPPEIFRKTPANK
ncbi:hypothetical protein [Chlorobium phaeobacteroides]|uniref:Uncharacterized protein n=1 Tax=Chlorobium phaeobacteroides (strain DSM 266 / SMG 266 / 2430) TaxID=290317 RepID=A1BE09_CHLPD|nr:hypothetical protein [Chlorobium phaeobacteroides]ABL64636.1 conserved hypothetical protein [Chlorobium phaeobacteroides DSM 266]